MCVCQGITIVILLTWIEILIGGGGVVPDNMEGGLLHHQVGHQSQWRVSRKLTQVRTWKSSFSWFSLFNIENERAIGG